ncbi:hypothetical protein GGP91_000188 [Salinibacter ruber]|jgi:hypothetical protein|nr:hypothetical protein [Salinibacter ruber]MBB4061509.1 hypothetical protein [Salinibacter ruber]MBB4067760.1 hypothetical protein [Salinibacter ruber]MBB4090157.1 hypothetical protein [Salinibacter ruber]MCS3612363.1 hypothetical protein [Salinibacter ruber]MCS3615736.1 hypothetical protein [Salinibacter ruber]
MSTEAHERQTGSTAAEDEQEADPEQFSGRSLLLADEDEAPSEVPNPDVEALRALVAEADCQCAPYQSVAVAAVQILEKALRYERQAASAALSLGQQEKMRSMVETAEQAVSVLRDTLTAQGHKVMHLCTEKSPVGPASAADDAGQPWWFTLSNALEVLEQGTDQMTSLTTGQSPGSAARELSQLTAQLLRSHHDALLLEAEEWIS